jgi:hypothetical protein
VVRIYLHTLGIVTLMVVRMALVITVAALVLALLVGYAFAGDYWEEKDRIEREYLQRMERENERFNQYLRDKAQREEERAEREQERARNRNRGSFTCYRIGNFTTCEPD